MRTWFISSMLPFFCACLIGAGLIRAEDAGDNGPMYEGKPLSVWVDELHFSKVVDKNRPAVRAVRSIGTNAIPWLLEEMTRQSPREQGSGGTNFHQLRARVGFWTLGELGAPAIPKLRALLEQQPEFVPSALAGIGVPALPALEHCLTNAPHYVPPYLVTQVPSERCVGSALAALFVAIDAGRISASDAVYLLPTVRLWAKDTNRNAAYWAQGVLEKLGEEP